MSEEEFQKAIEFIKSPNLRNIGLDRATLLSLYGLFKTATVGANGTPKPSWTNITETAKWKAWTSVASSTTKAEARSKYIELVKKVTNKSKL